MKDMKILKTAMKEATATAPDWHLGGGISTRGCPAAGLVGRANGERRTRGTGGTRRTVNSNDNCIEGHLGGAISSPSIQYMLLSLPLSLGFVMPLHVIFMSFMRCSFQSPSAQSASSGFMIC
jgi:hypothetical protein